MPRKTQNSDGSDKEISVLTSLYESAKTQSNHEGDLIWQKFNGFIVTHAIFFALISGIITTKKLNSQNIYLIILSVAGFFLSLLWLISTIRGYEALHYWQNSATEIASKLFKLINNYKLENYYKKGKTFFKQNGIVPFSFDFEKETKYIQRSCFTRFLRINTEWTAYFCIGLIMLLYVLVPAIFLRNILSTNKHQPTNKIQYPQKRQLFNRYHK